MPGSRYKQKAFFHTRWGHCSICQTTDRYNVNARKGERLRDQRCTKCGAILGKNASTRAVPNKRLATAVEELAKRMQMPKLG